MKFIDKTPRIPFMKHRFLFLVVSLLLMGGSLFSVATRGLNFGTDFLGGVKLQYRFPTGAAEGEVHALLEKMGMPGVSVIRFGDASENRLAIKISHPKEAIESYGKTITPELQKAFGAETLLEMEETVGAKVGEELKRKGILAVLFSLFCMLVYVGFRFDFHFAPGAMAALFHDVIVVLGVFSFFGIEFDLTILAACLTIVGYSLNDTIIIFDRVREHAKLVTPATVEEVVNTSVNETLSRTMITSLTTLAVVVILFCFGGATLRDFSLAMILGIVFGTYSTIFISCTAYIGMVQISPKLEKRFGKQS